MASDCPLSVLAPRQSRSERSFPPSRAQPSMICSAPEGTGHPSRRASATSALASARCSASYWGPATPRMSFRHRRRRSTALAASDAQLAEAPPLGEVVRGTEPTVVGAIVEAVSGVVDGAGASLLPSPPQAAAAIARHTATRNRPVLRRHLTPGQVIVSVRNVADTPEDCAPGPGMQEPKGPSCRKTRGSTSRSRSRSHLSRSSVSASKMRHGGAAYRWTRSA